MWIYLTSGFVSVVAHRDQPGDVLVRARCKQHLEAFLAPLDKQPALDHNLKADYPWRVVITKAALAKLMAQHIDAIEYDNFKASVRNGQYLDALYNVYAATLRLDDAGGGLGTAH